MALLSPQSKDPDSWEDPLLQPVLHPTDKQLVGKQQQRGHGDAQVATSQWCKHKALRLFPQARMAMLGAVGQTGSPRAGWQRRMDPWGSLASQPSEIL